MRQIIGVGDDSSKIRAIFNKKDTKACLLVFVSENYARQSGQLARAVLNDFNKKSFDEGTNVQIAYPIYSNFEDESIRALWNKYNPSNWIPAFVFTKSNGEITGISHFGLPTTEQLRSELSLLISK